MDRRSFVKNMAALLAVSQLDITHALSKPNGLYIELMLDSGKIKINADNINIEKDIRHGYIQVSSNVARHLYWTKIADELVAGNSIAFTIYKLGNTYYGLGIVTSVSIDASSILDMEMIIETLYQ